MGATESGVFALAREAGIELERGATVPWLTNRGHLTPMLAGVVPETTLAILSTIHRRLGGDERLLAGKHTGSGPRPDFVLSSANLIVEVDEVQHFTSDRLTTLELYPRNAELAFDVAEYRALIGRWSSVADSYSDLLHHSCSPITPAHVPRAPRLSDPRRANPSHPAKDPKMQARIPFRERFAN
jgi:hypothetical protein